MLHHIRWKHFYERHSIKSESGTPAITEVFDRVPHVVRSCSSSVAMTASRKSCSDIVYTLPSWCTWGLRGNQNGIMWLWRTIRADQWENVERWKEKTEDQIINYASCHFYSCFAKNVCVFLCFFIFLSYFFCLFMQAWDNCCQYIGCIGRRT